MFLSLSQRLMAPGDDPRERPTKDGYNRRQMLKLGAASTALIGMGIANVGAAAAAPAPTRPAQPAGSPTLPPFPAVLPRTLLVGLGNSGADLGWLVTSGIPWQARFIFLTGGANTPKNWSTINAPPAGKNAADYMAESAANGCMPVFIYSQMLASLPAVGTSESGKEMSNLNNPTTMAAYFANWKLLMTMAKQFGKPVIVHHEPDFWGYVQKVYGTDGTQAPTAVASSGYSDALGYANSVSGFAQVLVHMRDAYAPNVLLSYDIAPWAGGHDVSASNRAFDVLGQAQKVANLFLSLNANFDLMLYRLGNRDAGYSQYVQLNGTADWWDPTNVTLPNFARFAQWVAAITQGTGRRGMLWHVPIGNQVYDTMNDTTGHYQDNRVEYFLGANWKANLAQYANAGIVGILFGAGPNGTTSYADRQSDGITNPPPINGNTKISTVSDDDGGYLRSQAAAYFAAGGFPLP